MSDSILITGASGLIGTHLTKFLQREKYSVFHLCRAVNTTLPTYLWNIEKGYMDRQAVSRVRTIVHLAGAGVADKRWTLKRKKEILESRIKTTKLLFKTLKNNPNSIDTFISASAIGYYDMDSDQGGELTEESTVGKDFLASVTHQWECAVDAISSLGIRTIKLRLGTVLAGEGGALNKMTEPIKKGFGSSVGRGTQYVNWIHVEDVCGIFMHVLKNPHLYGIYNAVAPSPVTYSVFTHITAGILKKPLWFPPVPAWVIKLLYGGRSDLILKGSRVSCSKIQSTGYTFHYPYLKEALENLLIRNG